MGECEYACVQHIHVYGSCMQMCAQTHKKKIIQVCVGTNCWQLLLEPLCLSQTFFFSPELKKPVSQ